MSRTSVAGWGSTFEPELGLNKMHILFLTDNFPPEVNAPASRTFEHCREWVKYGHNVTVITCAPNFPKGKLFDGYRNKFWQSEDMSGIKVIRVWSYISSNDGFLKRILDYLSYMVTATLASFFVRKVDIIVGTSPQFFTACAAWGASLFKRRPWVFELRDIWPESIRAVGAMDGSRSFDALEKLELFLYRQATMIVSVTHSFKRNLVGRGVEPGKIHVVTNGADLEQFHPSEKDPELEAHLGLKGRFTAGYIGTHGMAHGLETLLEAARLLQDEGRRDIRLLLLGDGASKVELLKRAQAMELDNVVFVDTVAKSLVRRYWSLLDASIIHLRATPLFESVIPSKLFECMAMGVPVLHGVRGESAEIVEAYDVGLTFEPGNSEQLRDRLVMLADNQTMAKRLGANGVAAAGQFSRSALAAEMLNRLTDVVGVKRH